MSLWERLGGLLAVNPKEITAALQRLIAFDEQATPEPTALGALVHILGALRCGVRAALGRVEPMEEALAYALQVLVYQRYVLAEQRDAVTPAMAEVANYWLGQLVQC